MQGIEHKQTGASMIFMLIFFVLLGSDLIFALHVAPIYFDDLKVKRAFDNLSDRVESANRSSGGKSLGIKNDVLRALNTYFRINGIRGIDLNNALEYRRTATGGDNVVLVVLHYEVRKNIVGNLDVVLTFEHSAKVAKT